MDKFNNLIIENKLWLIKRIIDYTENHNYLRYLIGLEPTLNSCISQVNELLLETWYNGENNFLELSINELKRCKITNFAIKTAEKHRRRGINLGMFSSLMIYLRKSYLDLFSGAELEQAYQKLCIYFIAWFFDHMDISTSILRSNSNEDLIQKLQEVNNEITDKKVKYLTLFETLPTPAILLDKEYRIESLNHSAAKIFTNHEKFYSWLSEELEIFKNNPSASYNFEKVYNTDQGSLYFEIKIKCIINLKAKCNGSVIILNDSTARVHSDKVLYP